MAWNIKPNDRLIHNGNEYRLALIDTILVPDENTLVKYYSELDNLSVHYSFTHQAFPPEQSLTKTLLTDERIFQLNFTNWNSQIGSSIYIPQQIWRVNDRMWYFLLMHNRIFNLNHLTIQFMERA